MCRYEQKWHEVNCVRAQMGKHRATTAPNARAQPGGVTKAQPISALGASILARKGANQMRSSKSAAAAMAFLAERTSRDTKGAKDDVSELLAILRECVAEAGGGITLPSLGEKAKEKAMRRRLASGHSGNLTHETIKGFGGWHAFVQSHAGGEFVVTIDGLVRPATGVEAQIDPIKVHRPPATTADVNSLSLDHLM